MRRLSPRRVKRALRRARLRAGVAIAALALLGCYVGPDGEFESVSETTDGGGDDGFEPEPVACSVSCTNDSNCCDLNQPPVSLVSYACPGEVYPNNWKCVGGACRQQTDGEQGVGCDPTFTGQEQCRVPGYVCREINGVGHCVATCTVTPDCDDYFLVDATCETVDGVSICMQNVP